MGGYSIDIQEEEEQRRRPPVETPQVEFPMGTGPAPAPAASSITKDQAREQYLGSLAGKQVSNWDEENRQFEDYWKNALESGLMQGPGYSTPWADILAGAQARNEIRYQRPTASAGGIGGDLDLNEDGQLDTGALTAIARAQAGGGGGSRLPSTQPGLNMPGAQFTDPYTTLYEDTAKRYLERLTGQNAELDRLMNFIGTQFAEKSNSQGYSPEEQALLRTQALEPIERDRAALNRRVLERTSARGFLPSSGLNELDMREVDRDAETRRTVAQRDLAINAINKRQADQQQALQLAQLGLQIPNQQGQQAMSVANSLYQLPRNALMDSLQVLNASSPQSAISPLIQLQQQQQQQALYDQQRTAAMWQQIGSLLAGMF